MENYASYSLLHREFEFVGLDTVQHHLLSIFPHGRFLVVRADLVWELVEQFQFFQKEHLHCLADLHSLPFTSRFRRQDLIAMLHRHRDCCCPRVSLLFEHLSRPRPDVRVVHLRLEGAHLKGAEEEQLRNTAAHHTCRQLATEEEIQVCRSQDAFLQYEH